MQHKENGNDVVNHQMDEDESAERLSERSADSDCEKDGEKPQDLYKDHIQAEII